MKLFATIALLGLAACTPQMADSVTDGAIGGGEGNAMCGPACVIPGVAVGLVVAEKTNDIEPSAPCLRFSCRYLLEDRHRYYFITAHKVEYPLTYQEREFVLKIKNPKCQTIQFHQPSTYDLYLGEACPQGDSTRSVTMYIIRSMKRY